MLDLPTTLLPRLSGDFITTFSIPTGIIKPELEDTCMGRYSIRSDKAWIFYHVGGERENIHESDWGDRIEGGKA